VYRQKKVSEKQVGKKKPNKLLRFDTNTKIPGAAATTQSTSRRSRRQTKRKTLTKSIIA